MPWPEKALRELVAPTETVDPRKTPGQEFTYVDISSVDNNAKEITSPSRLLGADAPTRARKVIRQHDVIVATTRPYLNQVAAVPAELDGEVCSTGFCVLRPGSEVVSRYLFWFTRTRRFMVQVLPKMRGSTYPAVSDGDVLDVRIPVPPREIQERIVRQLDAALNQAESIRTMIKEADETLNLATSSLVEAAYRGES